MKEYFDLVIVMPVGPGTEPAFAADTLHSAIHHATHTFKIIIIDDSQQNTGNILKSQFPNADVLCTGRPNGRLAGLYITLCTAFKYALDTYRFIAVFKIDTDALVINSNYETDALIAFKSGRRAGMAGQYGREYNGDPWDISWPRTRIFKDTCTIIMFKNPVANFALRKWYVKARRNGYKRGESVFGGAYFIGHRCLQALAYLNLLPEEKLRHVNLEEDHLFSLLVKAAGFELRDLSRGTLPFACKWHGLPAAPEELYNEGKKIIHSTRYWQNMEEADIRKYFSSQRQQNLIVNEALC